MLYRRPNDKRGIKERVIFLLLTLPIDQVTCLLKTLKPYATPLKLSNKNIPFTLMLSLFYLIICICYVQCQKTMRTIQNESSLLNTTSLIVLLKPNVSQRVVRKKASAVFGNAGFGSIAYVMNWIIALISIISLLLKIRNPVKHGYVEHVQD